MSFVRIATAWMRSHLLATIVGSLVTGGGAAVTVYSQLEQNRVTRFEERMLSEYEKVSAAKQSVAVSLNKFTNELANGEQPTGDLVQEMTTKLVEMYYTLDSFKIGLSEPQLTKVQTLQTSINEFKTELQRTTKKDDLQYLASRFVDFEEAFQSARPVVEDRIGAPLLKS